MNDSYDFWTAGPTVDLKILEDTTNDMKLWIDFPAQMEQTVQKCTAERKRYAYLELYDPETKAPLNKQWRVSESTYNILMTHLGK